MLDAFLVSDGDNGTARENEDFTGEGRLLGPGFRVLAALCASLFVTSGGTIAALLAISLEVYEYSGSHFWAGAVFASQWVLPLAGLPLLMKWCSARPPRNLLIFSELIALGSTLLVPWFLGSAAVLAVCVLLLRGFLEALTKSAASVALKPSGPQASLERANTALEISRLMGYSAGAAVAARYLGNVSLSSVVLADAATFGLSALLISLAGLGTVRSSRDNTSVMGGSWVSGLRFLQRRPRVWIAFWLLGLVTIFQGIHYVVRTALPIDILDKGADTVSLLTSLSTLSVLGGSLMAARLVSSGRIKAMPHMGWLILPAAGLYLAVSMPQLVPSFVSYCIFLAIFEMGYVAFNNRLVVDSLKEEAGVVLALRGAVMPTIMLFTVLITGLGVDGIGLRTTAYVTGATVIVSGLWLILGRRDP